MDTKQMSAYSDGCVRVCFALCCRSSTVHYTERLLMDGIVDGRLGLSFHSLVSTLHLVCIYTDPYSSFSGRAGQTQLPSRGRPPTSGSSECHGKQSSGKCRRFWSLFLILGLRIILRKIVRPAARLVDLEITTCACTYQHIAVPPAGSPQAKSCSTLSGSYLACRSNKPPSMARDVTDPRQIDDYNAALLLLNREIGVLSSGNPSFVVQDSLFSSISGELDLLAICYHDCAVS